MEPVWLNDSVFDNSTQIERTLVEQIVGMVVFAVIISVTIVGNGLVIIAIFTYRPLKKVQNLFMISLSAADLAVAVLVMPYHVVQFVAGRWVFNFIFCQIWITCDILLCTCSIMNLCAIALDRYWAIHDPIVYAGRRTKQLVNTMICIIWIVSGLVSVPPLFGWNDWSDFKLVRGNCQYTSQTGFVIFSALVSFYLPLLVMTTVYAKIYCAARNRIRRRMASRTGSVKSTTSTTGGGNWRKESDAEDKERGGVSPFDLMQAVAEIDNDSTTLQGIRADMFNGRLNNPQTIARSELLASGLPKAKAARATRPVSTKRPRLASRRADDGSRHSAFHVGVTLLTTADSLLAAGPVCARQKRLSRYQRFKKSLRRTGSEASVTTNDGMNTYFKERERISLTKEKKAAKTLAIIMSAFVLCWLPFFLLYLIRPLCETCWIPQKLFEAANWLGYINSCLNPIIYTVFNTEFRTAFQRILHRIRTQQPWSYCCSFSWP